MKTALKVFFILALIGIFSTLFFMPISTQESDAIEKTKIVTTIFPAYDFTRTLSADTNVDLKLLIKPGTDIHSYDPTPQDIASIKEADIFIYNGGKSEEWVSKILDELDKDNTVIVRMMDAVELKEEDNSNIVEKEAKKEDTKHEYDEHIWTSPKNVKSIADNIAQALINRTPNDTSIVQHNLEKYKADLDTIDGNFRQLAQEKTGTLIVADRFPFKYFVDEYGFDYIAAFPGCSEQSEPSAKTVAELSKKVEQNPQKIIFHLELSNTKITQTIAKSTKAKVLNWHSVHNVSQKDFDSGKTYLDFMRDNLANLGEALHDKPTNK